MGRITTVAVVSVVVLLGLVMHYCCCLLFFLVTSRTAAVKVKRAFLRFKHVDVDHPSWVYCTYDKLVKFWWWWWLSLPEFAFDCCSNTTTFYM